MMRDSPDDTSKNNLCPEKILSGNDDGAFEGEAEFAAI